MSVYTRFERVFFDVVLLKKRKKSFWGGKLLGARPVLVAISIWRNFRAGFFMPVSVASSDGVTASPGSTQSDGTVLSAPADTAAAGAPADTRASPASPGSSASSHDPIRDMDFDNVPALSCSWSDIDQELYERALNITPELDRPKTSKGRPRIPHLRKVLTERGQAFKTSDNVETLWRLCAESHWTCTFAILNSVLLGTRTGDFRNWSGLS